MSSDLTDLRRWYLACREAGIRVEPHIAAIAIRAAGNYSNIRARYQQAVYTFCKNYLSGALRIDVARSAFKREMATAFMDAFETGFMDGRAGAKRPAYDPDPEDSAWLASMTRQEMAYIDQLFVSMREIRRENPEPAEIDDFAADRADGYTRTLDGVYAQAKLRSNKNKMLTFDGVDGKESCKTCQKYKRQRHRASWWLRRGLVPTAGNSSFECGCWQCQHGLYDDDGNQWAGVRA